jgi:hypothetical protein
MAPSRKPGLLGRDPFELCAITPGPLGINDAASVDAPSYLLGDTPGPLGCNDYAAPEASDVFGIGKLHLTVSWDKELLLWDYDPERLLDDPNISPAFAEAAHTALAAAVRSGLRPKVHEAYRTPEESDRKHQKWKAGKGGRAAASWRSCHNFGLAMDVYLYDQKEKYIDNHVKGWYKLYKLLSKPAIAAGFVWGEGFGDGDADHFEFHPKWPKGANGAFLLKVKGWAQQAALSAPGAGVLPNKVVGPVREPPPSAWMPYFWWAAGAGGAAPSSEFLTKDPPPTQAP